MSDTSSDMMRMLNVGKKVNTQKFGEVNVKELSFEQTILCAKDIIRLLMSSTSEGVAGKEFFFNLLSNSELATSVKRIVALSISKSEDELKDISTADMLKLLVAFKEVVNWKELSDLFFQLVPTTFLQNLRKDVSQQTQVA